MSLRISLRKISLKSIKDYDYKCITCFGGIYQVGIYCWIKIFIFFKRRFPLLFKVFSADSDDLSTEFRYSRA